MRKAAAQKTGLQALADAINSFYFFADQVSTKILHEHSAPWPNWNAFSVGGIEATLRNQLRAYLGLADGVVIICFGISDVGRAHSLNIERTGLHDEIADWGRGPVCIEGNFQ